MELKAAIFKRYGGDWQSLANELDLLAQVSSAQQEDVALYVKGFNDSLSVSSRVKLCEFLGLDPDDYPELNGHSKKK
ncbi:hypothetical protein [Arenibacter sp. ARW7G5Y1]|uniref:hypothetical protein n=1 Tax=Arenibacter sp. ARW7G5Y1 TaxID=2135619 RepID=UPI000D75731F|nr:hypothetical protein [Arenibacter sp. ARW7G5Y1]PXX27346.1 hypothetical protein C7972_107131 [Arenibacter sp. ARW7G5Y1]